MDEKNLTFIEDIPKRKKVCNINGVYLNFNNKKTTGIFGFLFIYLIELSNYGICFFTDLLNMVQLKPYTMQRTILKIVFVIQLFSFHLFEIVQY